MNKQEFTNIAVAIKEAYPNANVLNGKTAMDLWFRMLEDLDYSLVQNAVLEHISTNKYAPAISEIREQCANRMQVLHDWDGAWGEVMKAIRFYGQYREEEALASLNDLTRQVVKRFGFRKLCITDNEIADRAHFKSAYQGMVKEAKNQFQLPKFVIDEKNKYLASNQMGLIKQNPDAKIGEEKD